MEKVDFSKFGKTFQEDLAHLVVEDRSFSDQMQELLNFDFFEFRYLQVFVQKVFDYRIRYGVHPTSKILISILRTELEDENDATKKQVRDYFARIYNSPPDIREQEYIKSVALDFCKKQKLKEAMIESVKLLKKSSFDEISEVLNQALKLGSDNNFGYDYKADFEERFQLKARNPVSTGWADIDGIIGGGLGKGELGVVIAPTGAGKSMALVHLGAEAVKQGKTVIHYTLELASVVIGKRYDSCITGIMMNDLHSLKEEVYEQITELPGELIIKEYPTKSASPNDLKIHLEKLRKRDIEVDMIIVDYGDLLKPNVMHKEKRIELERIYEHLRGLAQEFNCPCYTASQTNRSGLNAEVITMESISEAFNKCFVADFIFTLSRTTEDKNTNSGRVFVAKNRNGPDGLIYPIYMNTGNVKIKVLPPTGETIADIAVNSAKKQEKLLKENYKEWKQDKKSKET